MLGPRAAGARWWRTDDSQRHTRKILVGCVPRAVLVEVDAADGGRVPTVGALDLPFVVHVPDLALPVQGGAVVVRWWCVGTLVKDPSR